MPARQETLFHSPPDNCMRQEVRPQRNQSPFMSGRAVRRSDASSEKNERFGLEPPSCSGYRSSCANPGGSPYSERLFESELAERVCPLKTSRLLRGVSGTVVPIAGLTPTRFKVRRKTACRSRTSANRIMLFSFDDVMLEVAATIHEDTAHILASAAPGKCS